MFKLSRLALAASVVIALTSSLAAAQPPPPLRAGAGLPPGFGLPIMRTHAAPHWDANLARQVWTPVKAAGPFSNGADTPMLMMDGTVLVHDYCSNLWDRLTPNSSGSYILGKWSKVASMSSGYGPLYYASAILPDGRLIVQGGEYNFCNGAETNLGAIYDPLTNKWASVTGPSGWSQIGDASSVILANGTYMLGNCCTAVQALLDATNMTWTSVGTGKADVNSEEGWSLLPDNSVLTVDVLNGTQMQSERYFPGSKKWKNAGNTVVELVCSCYEYGSQVLRFDGTVFVSGGTNHTAIYNTASHTWAVGPDFPNSLDVTDGPGALLPDGNVLVVASPGTYSSPSSFFEWNGTKLIAMPNPPNASSNPSFVYRMLSLPNGQTMVTDGSGTVYIYTHDGKPNPKYAPQISSVPTTLTHGSTYTVSGTYLNGYSQTGMYGDDAQAATNFPIVRITNTASGHVFYCRAHDPSSMAVASPATVSASFDVPSGIETGASNLEVVANGIPSAPVAVTVN